VAYSLEFHEKTVVPYLLNLDLSREGRVVLARLLYETRIHADTYVNDSERRLAPGSDCFRVDLIFRDPVSRVIHQLQLILSDAPAPYGVLRVVYAEDHGKASGS
jgi:hypothetical protein